MSKILQIAREAQVSPRTVLNALKSTGKGVRSDATARADRIRRIAAELGYRPHGAARAMRRGRFRAIGVVSAMRGYAGGIPPAVQWGLQERLQEEDFHLAMGHVADDKLTDGVRLPRLLREWMVDALAIAYTVEAPPALLAALDRWQLPVAWLNVKRAHDAVHPDDLGSAVAATEHLLTLGHRRIAYLDLPPGGPRHYSTFDRRAGYERAVRDAGLEPSILLPPPCARYGDPMRAQGRWATELLRSAGRPTAVLAYSDNHARWFLEAAEAAGLRVPTDLSLLGWTPPRDDDDSCRALGRLVLPHYQMGRVLVEMLLQKIESPAPLATRVLPVALRPGDTVAPPFTP